jgi:adenine specific DNA methylase Mod
MMAYLAIMVVRQIELHRVLKPTGSLYLHCDPTASHYLKILLDAVFGPRCFRNEIIWKRTTAHSSSKRYAPIHDTLFYYSGSRPLWNETRAAYEDTYLDKYYKYDDGDGKLYWRADITGAGLRGGESGRPWRGRDPSAINAIGRCPKELLESWLPLRSSHI